MEKNFLETVNNEYPESFREEKFVANETKSKWPVILGIAITFVVIGIIFFFVFNKKIVMEDFISKSKESLNIWVKENGLNSKNIIYTYEFSDKYDANIIISQSIEAGKKISKNKVLTFTISKGADPDTKIKFPDIKNMTHEEIKDWINDNKLPNVKVTQEYSDEFEKDSVISYSLRNLDESEFTRSSNLSIVISKGSKEKSQITMPNYVGKSYESILLWAEDKNIKIDKTEIYSNKPVGEIVSQSIEAGKKIDEGSTITIAISKGASVYIPNLIGQNKMQVVSWSNDNDISIIYNEVYSDIVDKNRVVSQSISSGSYVGEGDTMIITISLGKPYLEDYTGKSINELKEWAIEANDNGCNINIIVNDKSYYSDEIEKNGIINQDKNGFVNLNETVYVTLSLGAKVLVDNDYIGLMEDDIKLFCSNLNCVYDYKKSDKPVGTIIDVKINDQTLKQNMYINSSDMILVTISEGE